MFSWLQWNWGEVYGIEMYLGTEKTRPATDHGCQGERKNQNDAQAFILTRRSSPMSSQPLFHLHRSSGHSSGKATPPSGTLHCVPVWGTLSLQGLYTSFSPPKGLGGSFSLHSGLSSDVTFSEKIPDHPAKTVLVTLHSVAMFNCPDRHVLTFLLHNCVGEYTISLQQNVKAPLG